MDSMENVPLIVKAERRPSYSSKPDYPKPTPEFAADMEQRWAVAQNDDTVIFAITGPSSDREETIGMARGWALDHSPRLSVIRYNHPDPEKDTEYFMLKIYRRRGKTAA